MSLDKSNRTVKKCERKTHHFLICRVSTRSSIPAFKKNQFSALRRFSDFLGLHDLLVEKYLRRGRIIPPAPQKNLIGKTSLRALSETKKF